MHFMKITLLFITYNALQLKRKWYALPLVLLLPIFIVGLLAYITITFVTPDEQNPIQVGLVDLDQSKETKLFINMLDETSELGSFIHVHKMSETAAKQKMENDEISSYILFPEKFTHNLYQGNPVTLSMIGNPNQPIQSQMVYTIMESVTTHIRASQANVLTLNRYAKKLPLDEQERNEFVFEQFKKFVFYTLGRKQLIQEEQLINQATATPASYYSLGGWFIIFTSWLLLIYTGLHRDVTAKMEQRMMLYNVRPIQPIFAKLAVTMGFVCMLGLGLLFVLHILLGWDIQLVDAVRIMPVIILYSFCFLLAISIVEAFIRSHRMRLVVQISLTLAILLLSGSIIPTFYLPLSFQQMLPFTFSSEAFYWLQELLLHKRLYVDYIPLLLMTAVGFFVLSSITIGKERLHR
ncbi:ABC-2 type transport system permease protein [Virgibacillus chiguensis]|uniref:ABC-2 type transport system permease protein n=2 Tax=Virgibacillus chiguensis TaxID=411959 RepID=A0A1M5V408_9BACI|nr:ABC-2 type transport system permease protein [Virgibacillus chiguensis]